MIARLLGFVRRRAALLRGTWIRASGVHVGAGTHIGPDCEVALAEPPHRYGTIHLGEACRLERGVVLHPYGGCIHIAPRVFIGPYAVVYGHGGVEIGEGSLISMHCRILSSNHTVPAASELIRDHPDVRMPTRIGRDVWIGAGATVLGGVTIGDGCIIGAGAVVTHDLPAFTISVGVPARPIRSRTDP